MTRSIPSGTSWIAQPTFLDLVLNPYRLFFAVEDIKSPGKITKKGASILPLHQQVSLRANW
jgi:hypothetical protein